VSAAGTAFAPLYRQRYGAARDAFPVRFALRPVGNVECNPRGGRDVLKPGETLDQRYKLLREIGHGGMSRVYLALDTRLELSPGSPRRVAVKVIDEELADDPEFQRRFKREGGVLASLQHDNIITIFDIGQQGNLAYLVYPYIEGGTLQRLLGRPLPVGEVAAVLAPIADALDTAHALQPIGIIHRDIKPSNVLLTEQGKPIVADFGLAHLATTDGDAQNLTRTAATLGTPSYMSPEQAAGDPVDGRADQYALAIIAYELLTGTLPFVGETPLRTAILHVTAPVPPPRARNPGIATATEAALLRALAKHPADRFPTCQAFVAALAPAGASADPARTALLAGRTAGANRSSGRGRWWLGGLAAAIVMIAAGGVWLATHGKGGPAHSSAAVANAKVTPTAALPLAGSQPQLVAGGGGKDDGTGFLDGDGSAAAFNYPAGVALGGRNDLLIADRSNAAVRRVAGSSVSTVAHSRPSGTATGSGAIDRLTEPLTIASARNGAIYVTDANAVLRVATNGAIAMLAGAVSSGYNDGTGAAARFNRPRGLAIDAADNVYVADGDNHRIRKIAPGGVVTTFAGSGLAGEADGAASKASFVTPSGLTIDAAGNLYVVDIGADAVRMITPAGMVSTILRKDATHSYSFAGPIAMNAAGTLFVAQNATPSILRIDRDHQVSALDISPVLAEINSPSVTAVQIGGMAVDLNGVLYFTVSNGSRLYKLQTP
jgi:hypothetical protein